MLKIEDFWVRFCEIFKGFRCVSGACLFIVSRMDGQPVNNQLCCVRCPVLRRAAFMFCFLVLCFLWCCAVLCSVMFCCAVLGSVLRGGTGNQLTIRSVVLAVLSCVVLRYVLLSCVVFSVMLRCVLFCYVLLCGVGAWKFIVFPAGSRQPVNNQLCCVSCAVLRCAALCSAVLLCFLLCCAVRCCVVFCYVLLCGVGARFLLFSGGGGNRQPVNNQLCCVSCAVLRCAALSSAVLCCVFYCAVLCCALLRSAVRCWEWLRNVRKDLFELPFTMWCLQRSLNNLAWLCDVCGDLHNKYAAAFRFLSSQVSAVGGEWFRSYFSVCFLIACLIDSGSQNGAKKVKQH